ncbi:MAG TPA: hypothetical protein VHT92_10985 [Candidatus Cybelea sp.]|nr:hypothetical protein [Candidatus Cybelea sp.]
MDDAADAVRSWVNDRVATLSQSGASPSATPLLYRLDQTISANSPVMSITGPIAPPQAGNAADQDSGANAAQPASVDYVFFVDLDPRANWEHPCAYVFVSDDKNVNAVDSTAPPSAKTNTPMIPVDYQAPSDSAGQQPNV